jgi:hypothetical protein
MITIVSGLPRSGTSLMMQMLEKGGMEILTDHARKADAYNEKGYCEYEKVKSIRRDNAWMQEAEGKAVKIITQLLPYIPPDHEYAVLYMVRPMEEILRSQKRMREHLPDDRESAAPEVLEQSYAKQVQRVQNWMEHDPRLRTLYVFYPEALNHPLDKAREIQSFLGLDLNPEAMASAVDASMRHQKSD